MVLRSQQEVVLDATPSEVAEAALVLEGNPYTLDGAPFYYDILDNRARRKLMCTSRQVFKSTTGAVEMLMDSIFIPHFRTLYVSPSAKQTKLFSKSRLQKLHDHSPELWNWAKMHPKGSGVWEKYYNNGAENYFSYAGDNPDRIRGYSTDSNKFDEMQDIVYDTVVPVVNETMSMSKYKKEYYAGTHKTLEGPLQWLWTQSTQCEWLVPCTGCNSFNILNSVEHIGKTGPICISCGKRVNPRMGFWHALNQEGCARSGFPAEDWLWGYHISQLMLPKNCEDEREWRDLLRKLNVYDEVRFYNEVLGVATASGTRFIERADLEAQCRDYTVNSNPDPSIFEDLKLNPLTNDLEIYAGIDWSGGGFSGQSRTVLWIFGVAKTGQHFKTLYFNIYEKKEAFRDLKHILAMLRKYRVKLVCADAGVGAHANSFLREKYGENRVMQVQYGSFKQHYSKGADRTFVDRTAAIDTFFVLIKRQQIFYPTSAQCADAFDDMMSLYSEVTTPRTGTGKKIWQRNPGTPDDALHAQVFAWLAAQFGLGRFKLYATPAENMDLMI